MKTWELSEARTKLREIIEQSKKLIPQSIVVDGRKQAVIVSHEYYCSMAHQNSAEWPGTGAQKRRNQQQSSGPIGLHEAIEMYPGDPEDLAELGRILDEMRGD